MEQSQFSEDRQIEPSKLDLFLEKYPFMVGIIAITLCGLVMMGALIILSRYGHG